MNEELLEKRIADYQHYMTTVGSWELKPTIEERLAAWRKEQELEKWATYAKGLFAACGIKGH